MIYDYLIVGSGLYGATCAYELKKRGLKVLVVEKRNHIGGNVFTKNISGINVHMYGAHIFHTNKKEIWNYINQFAEFNNYINQPIDKRLVNSAIFSTISSSTLLNISSPSLRLSLL